jgi:glycosyltransferase involved in cell wall biosynthesis
MAQLRILHVIPSLRQGAGGPTTACVALCEALAARGNSAHILTTDAGGFFTDSEHSFSGRAVAGPSITYYRTLPPRQYELSLGLIRRLKAEVPRADVVHIHALYRPHLVAARYAMRSEVPYFVQPHGVFNPYHRKERAAQKAIFDLLVGRRYYRHAARFVYASGEECQNAKAAGVGAKSVVIPWGVGKEFLSTPKVSQLFARYPDLQSKRLITFLGRLTAKKGLEVVVEAFAAIAGQHQAAHLVVAGPDEDGTGMTAQRQVRALGLSGRVSFLGLVTGDHKVELLQGSSGFVLPSRDESFGVAVAEAMAAGTPVVVTPEVAVHGAVEKAQAGFVVPRKPAAVSQALDRLLTDDGLATQLGRNGKTFARSEFCWDQIAARFEAAYCSARDERLGLSALRSGRVPARSCTTQARWRRQTGRS